MSQEILDNFKEPEPKAYEKAIDFLQGIKLKHRRNLVFLLSLGSYAIIEFKDSKDFDAATAFGVWVAMVTLAIFFGFTIKYLLVGINYIIAKTSGSKIKKVEELDYTSIALVFSSLMFLFFFILAVFVD